MTLRKNAELPLGLKYEDLPLWMRKTRREIDWAFLVMVVVSLVVIGPFLVRSGAPDNIGTRLEISRALEMSESIQAGILYPRWASDLNYGYGSPLWNYLAPLPHYLTGLHHVLVQSDPASSVKAVFALALLLGGLGMFSFVRRRCGSYAGILAATAYLYSPQIALVKPYLEGDLASLLAMGFFLLALWSFDRVLVGERGWDVSVSALILGGLWVSHTPLNLVLASLLAGWLGWRVLISAPQHPHWRRVWLSFALGTAISAFYWLPALVDHGAVYWRSSSDYALEAWPRLLPGEMLAQPSRLDFSAINPVQTSAIGVAVWGLAWLALGAVGVWNWRRTPPDRRPVTRGEAVQTRLVNMLRQMPPHQRETLYFAGIGMGLFGLSTPLAAVLWEKLPSWPQFYPRDLLPVIAACGAIVAAQLGYLVEQIRRPAAAVGMLLLCLGIILGLAFPTLLLPPWSETYSETTLSTLLRDETQGHMIATQVSGWLLPRTIRELPQPSPALVASYQAGMVDKVERDQLPPSVRVDMVEQDPQLQRLVVRAASPAVLTMLTFNFPGWQARIDGRPAALQTEAATGFMTLAIPEGEHEVTIHFGSTRSHDLGWVLASTALLLALIAGFYVENRLVRERSAAGQGRITVRIVEIPRIGLLLAVLLLGIGGSVPRLTTSLFGFHSPRGVVRPAQHQLPRALQGGVDLLAYDVDKDSTIQAGDDLVVTLYWRAVRPDLPDYQVDLALTAVDDPARTAAVILRRHPGMLPSSQWSLWPLLDYYVRDSYYLRLDKNALPGEYNIVVQLGRCSQFTLSPCKTIDPLFVRDGRGSSLGQRIVLPGVVEVNR